MVYMKDECKVTTYGFCMHRGNEDIDFSITSSSHFQTQRESVFALVICMKKGGFVIVVGLFIQL